MPKIKHRTRTDMGYDALKVINEDGTVSPAILSYITRRANMSHKTAIEIVDLLGAATLIDTGELKYKGSSIFRVTSDGRKFMEEYESLQNDMKTKKEYKLLQTYMKPKIEFDYRKLRENHAKRH